MANKKLTIKEVTKRLDFCLQQIIQTQKATEYIHKVISFYIKYKGDLKNYTKYLEEQDAKSRKQNSEESSKGNEGVDSGKQTVKTTDSKSKTKSK
jgi:hypothetical protein